MFSFIRFGMMDNLLLFTVGIALEKYVVRVINSVLRHIGLSVETKSDIKFGLFVGMIGNAISDFVGGVAALDMRLAIGSFVGCALIVIVGIPFTFRVGRE